MANQTAKSLKDAAVGYLKAGRYPQALKKAQLGLKKFPKDTDFHAISGFALTEMKQYRKSIPHFVEASRMKPDDPQFAENLANALMQTGQIARALTYAEQKLVEFPYSAELTRVLDEIELKAGNWRAIIEYANERLRKEPENAKYYATRARAYEKIGFEADSTRDTDRAFELSPDNTAIAVRKAVSLHQSGDKQKSAELLWTVLERDPESIEALLQLSAMASRDQAETLSGQVDTAIAAEGHVVSELEFAKAHLIAKLQDLSAALPQFARANAAQHRLSPYHFENEEKKFQKICDLFPQDATLPTSGSEGSPLPIFVIGQPRSGTSLMEMMLSSMPNVSGCGELTLGADLSYAAVEEKKRFNSADALEYANEFRRLMPPIAENATAFVDKMPHNYQRVGFLLAAFPNAKVINMLRDPRDVGLSKWIRRFPAGGMRYASNLKSIAHSANLYRRYMTHWKAVFGDRILTIPYEKLVIDAETYSKKVASFCGIEWHGVMMHPEKNAKQVRTASIDQVRQKISTNSIGGWRDVAEHLEPMLKGFDPSLWPEYDFS